MLQYLNAFRELVDHDGERLLIAGKNRLHGTLVRVERKAQRNALGPLKAIAPVTVARPRFLGYDSEHGEKIKLCGYLHLICHHREFRLATIACVIPSLPLATLAGSCRIHHKNGTATCDDSSKSLRR